MPAAKVKEKNTLSFGTISIVETTDGGVRMALDFERSKTTPDEVFEHIISVIQGLSYVYSKDAASIESVGLAYMAGLEQGIATMDRKHKADKGGSGDTGAPTMGFRANI